MRPLTCPECLEGMVYGEFVENIPLLEDLTHADEPMHEGDFRRWRCAACPATWNDPRNIERVCPSCRGLSGDIEKGGGCTTCAPHNYEVY